MTRRLAMASRRCMRSALLPSPRPPPAPPPAAAGLGSHVLQLRRGQQLTQAGPRAGLRLQAAGDQLLQLLQVRPVRRQRRPAERPLERGQAAGEHVVQRGAQGVDVRRRRVGPSPGPALAAVNAVCANRAASRCQPLLRRPRARIKAGAAAGLCPQTGPPPAEEAATCCSPTRAGSRRSSS